jgi:hypothetical protein
MNYSSVCRRWRSGSCQAPPETLLKALLASAIKKLPEGSLGHAKGYAEYSGGAVFASSTILPPEIKMQQQGEYQGGEIKINLALIFAEMDSEVLEAALGAAHQEAQERWDCQLQELIGEIDGL